MWGLVLYGCGALLSAVSPGLGVLILLVLIFIAQNSQTVKIKFLFFDASMPLIFGLLIAVILGVLIGYIGPIVRRAIPRRGYMRIDPATRTFQALRDVHPGFARPAEVQELDVMPGFRSAVRRGEAEVALT
jgi:uncharacterized integral membrane protein